MKAITLTVDDVVDLRHPPQDRTWEWAESAWRQILNSEGDTEWRTRTPLADPRFGHMYAASKEMVERISERDVFINAIILQSVSRVLALGLLGIPEPPENYEGTTEEYVRHLVGCAVGAIRRTMDPYLISIAADIDIIPTDEQSGALVKKLSVCLRVPFLDDPEGAAQ